MNIIIGDMSLLFSSLICYLIAIILSIVISLIIGLPLIGEKPIRYSWTSSAVFPTPIIAIGLLALCFSINFYWLYDGIVLAIICGVISPIIVRFLFDYIFPKPPGVD